MDLVIDANILFAILIKGGKTEDLLYNNQIQAYAPESLLEEFQKYKTMILDKTERTEKDFIELMEILKRRIKVVPNKKTNSFMREAEKTSPDKNDVRYFALAIMKQCAIWSNDKQISKQNRIKVFSTSELVRILS